ncbi:MAG: DUF4249 family protein [Terrimonas sp.]|nr:DUF4249 family protein [Terrimonas sp.]
MKIYSSLFVVVACSIFFSCEKAVSIDLKDASGKLVVDATIENGMAPVVILSKSLGYFSEINPTILANSFVRDAEVFISNGVKTHQLKEYAVPLGGGNTFYYYSIDSTDIGSAFTGELAHRYDLRIIWQGTEYKATTTIPQTTRHIDSLFWRDAPPGNDSGKVALVVRATDQPGYGDYIRYFTKRNSEPFYPGINSVYDDQIIDGITYEIEVERGVNKNEERTDGYTFFDKGDTVTLKLCNIDKATYDFWRTVEFSYANIGNPFSTPTKITGNISNNALGYFGGYAAQYRTIIIPR